MELRLQRYTKVYPIKTADFKKQCIPNLIYDEVITNGYITTELYYGDEDKTELVVEVDITYNYGPDTLVDKIDYAIHYYDEDGTIGMTVNKIKKPTSRQKVKLLKARRKTISESAQAAVIALLQMSYPNEDIESLLSKGGSFIVNHKYSLEIYEQVGSLQIVQDIISATNYWLDATPEDLKGATIRQYLIGVFSA